MLISTNVYDGETQARRDDVGENTHWDVFLFSPATHPQLRAFLFLPLSLSSFLSLSLFLFLRWFCSCKACNRKANCGRMIHMAMVAARVAGLWKEGACFFLTARNGREIKFLEDIPPIYLWCTWNSVDIEFWYWNITLFDAVQNSAIYLLAQRLESPIIEFLQFILWKNLSRNRVFRIDLRKLNFWNILTFLRMETLSDILCELEMNWMRMKRFNYRQCQ